MPTKKKQGKRKKAVARKTKTATKKKPVGTKAAARKASVAAKKASRKRTRLPRDNRGVETAAIQSEEARNQSRRGGQSGALQGLSDHASADSESVDELLEEGNAFEAEVVKGVEDVPDADEGPVHTKEVPEDDVPEEYQDPDE